MRTTKPPIPPPPAWLFWAVLVLAFMTLILSLAACSYPLRFDPNRQDQQRKQDQCLARGGSPKECRP